MAKPRILVVDDDRDLGEAIADYLQEHSFDVQVCTRASDGLQAFQAERPDALLLDCFLPDRNAIELIPELKALDSSVPIIVLTGHGSIDLAVRAVKVGADQFVTKPIELAILVRLLRKALEEQQRSRRQMATQATRSRYRRDPFLGTSRAIRSFADEVNKILGTDRPILIQGETGTGKGVLASWLHENGPRAKEAFIDLNCAGLSRELLDSELFGHERGAFTGAVAAKTGLLALAHHGTAFLDEIGDIDPAVQPKLLKFLEERKFRRLGGIRDQVVDVHLIAATHHDLARQVEDGRFRSDLFFRISTIPLSIPALRDRREDIPVLAESFVAQMRADMALPGLELAPDAIAALKSYSWPGNIRELRNVLERAALLARGRGVIRADALRFQLGVASAPSSLPVPDAARNSLTLADVERQHILSVLDSEAGRVEAAAQRLGIPRSTLYLKLKQYQDQT